jgi:hypothetical protein
MTTATSPTAASITAAIPTSRVGDAPTAQLLRLVAEDEHFNLVPVGISLHYFTDPARTHCTMSSAQIHRATTVLTKQVKAVLTGDHRLETVRGLVTDPHRTALPDGTTARQLCGNGWAAVRSIADQRAGAAVEGASTFGEAAILRLAATRAAMPQCPWWGTRGWTLLVDNWARRDTGVGRRSIAPMLLAPEDADESVLTAILDG